jgi:hypothetical protein
MCIDAHGVFYSHALGLSPLVTDRHLERVTSRAWLGAALVGGGVLCLIFNH